jgi:hypothetical protein
MLTALFLPSGAGFNLKTRQCQTAASGPELSIRLRRDRPLNRPIDLITGLSLG